MFFHQYKVGVKLNELQSHGWASCH